MQAKLPRALELDRVPSASISTGQSSVLGTRQDVEVIQRFFHGRDQRFDEVGVYVGGGLVCRLAVETESAMRSTGGRSKITSALQADTRYTRLMLYSIGIPFSSRIKASRTRISSGPARRHARREFLLAAILRTRRDPAC